MEYKLLLVLVLIAIMTGSVQGRCIRVRTQL